MYGLLRHANVCRLPKHPPTYWRFASVWGGVEQGPPDAIFGLVDAFNKDDNPNKVSLVVGAYRDNDGKPYVLPVVKKVSSLLIHNIT